MPGAPKEREGQGCLQQHSGAGQAVSLPEGCNHNQVEEGPEEPGGVPLSSGVPECSRGGCAQHSASRVQPRGQSPSAAATQAGTATFGGAAASQAGTATFGGAAASQAGTATFGHDRCGRRSAFVGQAASVAR